VIGVDVPRYESYLARVARLGPLGAFIASPAKAAYILVAYSAMLASGARPEVVAKFMPSLLLPAVVASSHLMVLKATRSRRLAATSSFLLATSPLVAVGVYGSFQANMMALALVYLCLALYLSADLRVAAPAAALLSALCHLSHSWTVIQVLAALALLAAARRDRASALIALSVAAGAAAGDCVKAALSPAPCTTVHIVRHYACYSLRAALSNLASLPHTMYLIVALCYGGFMNYPLLPLAVAGLLRGRDRLSDVMAAWAATAAVAYFSTWDFASRALLNLPIHVMAAREVARLRGPHLWAALSLSLSYYAMCLMNLVPPL